MVQVDEQRDRLVKSKQAKSAAWDRFYAYCFKIVNGCPGVRRLSTSDREDCVQEVMLEIVRKFGGEQPELLQSQVAGWVSVVARNKAADIARKRLRKHEVGFDDGTGSLIPADGASSSSLDVGESVSLVWEALLELDHEVTVTSYLAFFLRTIEEWSVPEVAEMMGMTSEQVRIRTCRVKARFAELMAQKGLSDPPSGERLS